MDWKIVIYIVVAMAVIVALRSVFVWLIGNNEVINNQKEIIRLLKEVIHEKKISS